jgi:hypothetical protein
MMQNNIANISVFESLQANQNERIGMSQMSVFQTDIVINNVYLKGSRKLEPDELKVVEDIKERMDAIEKKYLPKRRALNSESIISYQKGQEADRDVVELAKGLVKADEATYKEIDSKIKKVKAQAKEYYETYRKAVADGIKVGDALKRELEVFLPELKKYGVVLDPTRSL